MPQVPVPEDHFLRQFDRHPEGEERLRAMAAHSAYLLNSMRDQEERHRAELQGALDALRDAYPVVAIALDLADKLRETE